MRRKSSLTWCGILAMLAMSLSAFAQPALLLDPVERVRSALKTDSEPEQRDQATRAAMVEVQRLEDLRRAYLLPEWRDRSPESRFAEVDGANRTAVAERYAQMARTILRGKDEAAIAKVLDQVAELGATLHARGEDSRQWWSQDFPRLTRQGSARVRSAAARALAQTDPPLEAAIPVLAHLLKATEPALRLAAADGLAVLLDRAIQRVNANTTVVRAEDLLQLIATYRAVLPAAAPGLSDWHAAVRQRSAATLVQAAALLHRLLPEAMENSATSATTTTAGAEEVVVLIASLREQVPALARALRDADPQVRLRAQRAFEEIALARQRWQSAGQPGDPLLEALIVALPPIAEAVADPEVRVRRAAIDVLEPLGPAAAPAVPALNAALGDRDRFVRWSAVRALGSIGPAARPASRTLKLLLNDPDLDIRIAAAVALKAIGDMPLTRTGTIPPHEKMRLALRGPIA